MDIGQDCPRCLKDDRTSLGVTTNAFNLVCDRCNIRFKIVLGRDGQFVFDANDVGLEIVQLSQTEIAVIYADKGGQPWNP